MDVDFSQIEDIEDYLSVPEGHYRVRVAEVREGWTRDGEVRWAYRLEVTRGEYAGRTAAWDGVSFGERGLKRAKFVLSALGFDTSGRLEFEAPDLVGREVWVEVTAEDRTDPTTGQRAIRPRIPFAGYSREAEGITR